MKRHPPEGIWGVWALRGAGILLSKSSVMNAADTNSRKLAPVFSCLITFS